MSLSLFRVVRYYMHGDQEWVVVESPAEVRPNQVYAFDAFLDALESEMGGKLMVYFDATQLNDRSQFLADELAEQVELLYVCSPVRTAIHHKFDDIEDTLDLDDEMMLEEVLESFDGAISILQQLQAPDLPSAIDALQMNLTPLIDEVLKALVWLIEGVYQNQVMSEEYDPEDYLQSLLGLMGMAWHGWEEGLSINHSMLTSYALNAILDCISAEFLPNQLLALLRSDFLPYLVGQVPSPAEEMRAYQWLSQLDVPHMALCLSHHPEDEIALTCDDLLRILDGLLHTMDPSDTSAITEIRREQLSIAARALLENKPFETSHRWIMQSPRWAKLFWQHQPDYLFQIEWLPLHSMMGLRALMHGEGGMSDVDVMELYLTLQFVNRAFYPMNAGDVGASLPSMRFIYNTFLHLKAQGWETILYGEPDDVDCCVMVQAGMASYFFDLAAQADSFRLLGFEPASVIEMIDAAHHCVRLTGVVQCLSSLSTEFSQDDLDALMQSVNEKLRVHLLSREFQMSSEVFTGMLAFYEYLDALKSDHAGFALSQGYIDFRKQMVDMIQAFIDQCLPHRDGSVSLCFDRLMAFGLIEFFESQRGQPVFQGLSDAIGTLLMAQPSESFSSGGALQVGQFGLYRGERGWAAKCRLMDAFPTYQPEESGYMTEASLSPSDEGDETEYVISSVRYNGPGFYRQARQTQPPKTKAFGLNYPPGPPASGLFHP